MRGERPHLLALAALITAGAAIAAAQQAPAAPEAARATQAIPPPRPAPQQAPRFIVVLDAAHGGDDPGGRFGDASEKDLTLALGVRLRSLLAARGIAVVTTRESDASVSLDRRAELANHANAQACLSLHATQSGSGVHLFVSSMAPTPPARIPAWKTAQSAYVTRSLALAGVLNSALLHTGLPVTLGRTNLPAVDSMTCPAVAVEVAPDRSPDRAEEEPTAPDDPAHQARIAEAVAAAVLDWRSQGPQTEARQP